MINNIIKYHGLRKLLYFTWDATAFISGFILAYGFDTSLNFVLFESTAAKNKFWVLMGASVLSLMSFRYNKLYKPKVTDSTTEQSIILLKNSFYTFIFILILLFLFKQSSFWDNSRLQILLFIGFSYALIFLNRLVLVKPLHKMMNVQHLNLRQAIAIGAGGVGYNFGLEVKGNRNLGVNLVGFLDDNIELAGKTVAEFPVLGTTADLDRIIQEEVIDEIYITINSINHEELLSLVDKCRKAKCRVNIVSDHFGIIEKKMDRAEFKDLRYISVNQAWNSLYVEHYKRIFDIAGATLITLLFSPLLITVGLLIKLTSRGPVFYTANSIGKDGQPFKFYKFRSMFHNVSQESHIKLVEEFMSGKVVGAKLRNDPRVTKIGALIRKYSIDEFPQLINVFKGDMSLVGPRPSTQYEYDMMDDWHRKRYSVLPGMTGLWQVSGRAEVGYIDMIMMDIYYTENTSLWFDLIILLKTIGVVFGAKGGY